MEVDSRTEAIADSDGSSGSDEASFGWEDKEAEKTKVEEFITKTYGWHFVPKSTSCSSLSSRELIRRTTRMNCREMTKSQIDLLVLANLDAHQHYHHQGSSRSHNDYHFYSHIVCKCMHFSFCI